MKPPKPRVGEERERDGDAKSWSAKIQRWSAEYWMSEKRRVAKELEEIAAPKNGHWKGLVDTCLFAASLLRTPAPARGMSAQDKADLKLGRMVRGMKPGDQLYRSKLGCGSDHAWWVWDYAKKKAIMAPTPEAALRSRKPRGTK